MTSAPHRPSFDSHRPRPRSEGRPASPKAERFWASLREDLADVIAEAAALGVITAASVPADTDDLSAEQASAEIDAMLDDLRVVRAALAEARRAAQRTERDAARQVPASGALVPDRLYETPDGEIYRTYLSGQGNVYVKIWTTDGWDYEGARGALRSIRPEHRMSVERAKELSLQWAQCIRCGAELSNAVSVERGIGPICITKI